MIEKFNFYDVYGYFLPGLALIAVLWLPFGLVTQIWPKGDWGATLLTLALAYFLGHLMLYVSTNVVPSNDLKKSRPEKQRYPSETVLDADSSEFSTELREKIARAVAREFHLELNVKNSTGVHDQVRKDAFLLARQRLILDKAQGYAEQFQGMYSLTRGLVLTLWVGTAYYFGWVVSGLRWPPMFAVAIILNFLLLLLLLNEEILILREEDRKQKQRFEFYFALTFLSMFFASGLALGCYYNISRDVTVGLALAAVLALVLSFRCYTQYRYFTVRFATTIWRDFTAYALSHPISEKPKRYSSSLQR
jgi:hypothetical protein